MGAPSVDEINRTFATKIKQKELDHFFRALSIKDLETNEYFPDRIKKTREIMGVTDKVLNCANNLSKRDDPVLVDCGCGKSYLSFFIDFIFKKKGINAVIYGVDSQQELIKKCKEIGDNLDATNLRFFTKKVTDFDELERADITYGLHACNTATDEAIIKGVQTGSKFIVIVPCCYSEIIKQLKKSDKMREMPYQSLYRTQDYKEPTGIMITNTLRKMELESLGYNVKIFNYIPAAYSQKNQMIRAQKHNDKTKDRTRKYVELMAFIDYFGLKPSIEELARPLRDSGD